MTTVANAATNLRARFFEAVRCNGNEMAIANSKPIMQAALLYAAAKLEDEGLSKSAGKLLYIASHDTFIAERVPECSTVKHASSATFDVVRTTRASDLDAANAAKLAEAKRKERNFNLQHMAATIFCGIASRPDVFKEIVHLPQVSVQFACNILEEIEALP